MAEYYDGLKKVTDNPNKKLTHRQLVFVDEYLLTGNAWHAALKAGYSEKTGRQIASQLLNRPNIKAEIEKRQNKTIEKHENIREDVINTLKMMGFKHFEQEEITVKDSLDALGKLIKLLGLEQQESKEPQQLKVILERPKREVKQE